MGGGTCNAQVSAGGLARDPASGHPGRAGTTYTASTSPQTKAKSTAALRAWDQGLTPGGWFLGSLSS